MIYNLLTPTQSLDPAFRRQKPTRTQLDDFLMAQKNLLAAINPQEGEEHLKAHLRDFLTHMGVLGSNHYINVSQRRDLVVRLGPVEASAVGIIVEAKKPANVVEMVTPLDLNRKAFHELLLYYLEDRRNGQADNLRRLIITNGYEWFIFDALDFDRLFWRNTAFKGDFLAWADKKKAGKTTDYFYTSIAQPFIAGLDAELSFTYLDLRTEATPERELLIRAKLFQAPHLLKAAFAQDANTLNRAFYEELLYLIGLEEVKVKSRKLIKRVAPTEREHVGSLLRNTIEVLRSEDLLSNLSSAECATYGAKFEDQLFGVALELCLTWINRLLFLKLLEGQLRRYHAGNPATLTDKYRFLTPDLLPDFATLNDLFFKVLNTPGDQRTDAVKTAYSHLPYLNSSLYEISELERRTTSIRGLSNHLTLPLYRKSVLPTQKAEPHTLDYLLRFLDAYDFASEGDEQVQETHKSLISAAVLGLIFEKLNGYKDGSFYTPGFITMYMTRHTLRRAVVQHFNRQYGWEATDIAELSDAINNTLPNNAGKKSELLGQYSIYFNTLTVLDPAVGSGHFLVSALNELLAIKSELGLLLDAKLDPSTDKINYTRLRYRLTVARDELVVMHEDDDPENPNTFFQYTARIDPLTGNRTVAPAYTNLQRALFQEKRDLIERTLFGVDINPNSVRICRLRLWIELLKHAYYIPESKFEQLETLPNLDLNIKVGNSLLSQFDLSVDLSRFKRGTFNFKDYLNAKHEFFNTRDKAKKKEIQEYINEIKNKFTETIYRGDPDRIKVTDIKEKILGVKKDAKPDMFGKASISAQQERVKLKDLHSQLQKAEARLAERIKGTFYRNAFEWRFEFPEVLDDQGQFCGFDVVIGNPPYIRQEELAPALKQYLKQSYSTSTGTADLYVYFYELGLNLLAAGGELSFITNNKWLRAGYGQALRRHLLVPDRQLLELLDFGDLPVFSEATTYPNILSVRRAPAAATVRVAELTTLGTDPNRFSEVVRDAVADMSTTRLSSKAWSLAPPPVQDLLYKMYSEGTPLEEYVGGQVYRGILTGLDEAFVLSKSQKDGIASICLNSDAIIKPYLAGKDVSKYLPLRRERYVIFMPKGWTKQKYGIASEEVNWSKFAKEYPSVASHLLPFKEKAKKRYDKGDYWWELRACDYYSIFESPKIVYLKFQTKGAFTIDYDGIYTNTAVFSIPLNDKFLLGYLNSKIGWFLVKHLCTPIQNGFQLIFDYIKDLPIPKATIAQQLEIAALVEQILATKNYDPTANTSTLEQDIDKLVADLYAFSHAETALI